MRCIIGEDAAGLHHRGAAQLALLQKSRHLQCLRAGSYHTRLRPHPTVDIGDYKCPRSPDEPIPIDVPDAVQTAGRVRSDQNRIGPHGAAEHPFKPSNATSATSFSGHLAPADSTRRKTSSASRSNRWPHGYAMNTTRCSTQTGPNANTPHVIADPLRRIHNRNSDSGARLIHRQCDRSGVSGGGGGFRDRVILLN